MDYLLLLGSRPLVPKYCKSAEELIMINNRSGWLQLIIDHEIATDSQP